MEYNDEYYWTEDYWLENHEMSLKYYQQLESFRKKNEKINQIATSDDWLDTLLWVKRLPNKENK